MKKRKPRILIVDDEEGFTRLTRLTLTDYEIHGENRSARALETAQIFEPDLILLDVMMPEFDGGDVAAQIHADPKLEGRAYRFPDRDRDPKRDGSAGDPRPSPVHLEAGNTGAARGKHRAAPPPGA